MLSIASSRGAPSKPPTHLPKPQITEAPLETVETASKKRKGSPEDSVTPPLPAKKQQFSLSPVIEHMESRIRSKVDQGIFITANSISRKSAKWPLFNLLMEHCDYSFRKYVEFAKSYPALQPYLLGPHGAARHNIATFLEKLPPPRLLAACSEPVSYPDAKRLVFDYCLYTFPKNSVNKPLDLNKHSLVHSLLSLMLLKHNHVEPNLSAHDISHVQELCLEHVPIQDQILKHISADAATRQAAQKAISARSSRLAKMEGQKESLSKESLSIATDQPERGGLQRILDAKLDRQNALDQFVGKLSGETPFTAFGEHQFNELSLMNESRMHNPLESKPDKGLLNSKLDDKTLDVNFGNRVFDAIRNARTEKDLENILDQDPLRDELHFMLQEKEALLPTHLLHRIWGNASLEPSLEFSQQLARCANHDQALIMELAVDSRLFHNEVPELYKTIREVLNKDPKLKSPEIVEAMVRSFPNIRWQPPVPNLEFYRWALDQKSSQEVKRVLLSKHNLPREIAVKLAEDSDPKILEDVSKKFNDDVCVLCALASNPMRTESERAESIEHVSNACKNFPNIKNDIMSYVNEKYPALEKLIFNKAISYQEKSYLVPKDFVHPKGADVFAIYDKMDITNVVPTMHPPKITKYVDKIIKNWEEIPRKPFPPPLSAENFYRKGDASPSSTLTMFDKSLEKVRFLHGEDRVSAEMEEIHLEVANWIKSDKVPCINAKNAQAHGSYAVGIYQQLGSEENIKQNAKQVEEDLQKYISYQSLSLKKGNPFVFFMAVFPHHTVEHLGLVEGLLEKQFHAFADVSVDHIEEKYYDSGKMSTRLHSINIFGPHMERESHKSKYPMILCLGSTQFGHLMKSNSFDLAKAAVKKRDAVRPEGWEPPVSMLSAYLRPDNVVPGEYD